MCRGMICYFFASVSERSDRGDSCVAAEGEPSPSPLGVQGDNRFASEARRIPLPKRNAGARSTGLKRRKRDSNPRNVAVQQFSRLPPSTTRPFLHWSCKGRKNILIINRLLYSPGASPLFGARGYCFCSRECGRSGTGRVPGCRGPGSRLRRTLRNTHGS